MIDVPLSQGYCAVVDDADGPLVLKLKWHAKVRKNGTVYAATNLANEDGGYTWTTLHSFLLGNKPGFEIDHKDGDGLNNRRDNLRHCTHHQNMANRTGYGVSRFLGVAFVSDGRAKPWRASCKDEHLGYYAAETSAAAAYDDAAAATHGEFAKLNLYR